MKNKKDLRKFMKDLKKRRTFRSAIERARETKVRDIVVEKTLKRKEERMKDCMECKYCKVCSDEMKDQHWYYTHSTWMLGREYTFKLCTYILSHAFRKSFSSLTAEN